MGLLSIVPLPYRLAAIAALPLAGFACGWWRAAVHYHLVSQADADARERAVLQVQLQGVQRHAELLQQSKDRAETLQGDLNAAAILSSGMADRLRLQTAVRCPAAPSPSAGSGEVERSDGSSALVTELYRRQQLVFDAAAKCGAQEQALMSRPICECR